MLSLIALALATSAGHSVGDTSPSTLLPPEPPARFVRHCTPVDYRRDLTDPKSQGNTGFCFAYASAVLIQQRTGLEVSPLDLAMGFYFQDPQALISSSRWEVRNYLTAHPRLEDDIRRLREGPEVTLTSDHPFFHTLEGGFEYPTLILANARGLCADRLWPSDGGLDPHQPLIDRLERAARTGRGRSDSRALASLIPRFRDEIADRFHTAWLRTVAKKCRHVRPAVPIIPVSRELTETSREFIRLRNQGLLTAADQETVFAALDFALDHGRIAAAGLDLNTMLAEREEEDGDHSVVVVARRKVRGKCQYLIRDSSGTECDELRRPIRGRCAGRHFWLTEAELAPSFYGVNYLR